MASVGDPGHLQHYFNRPFWLAASVLRPLGPSACWQLLDRWSKGALAAWQTGQEANAVGHEAAMHGSALVWALAGHVNGLFNSQLHQPSAEEAAIRVHHDNGGSAWVSTWVQ